MFPLFPFLFVAQTPTIPLLANTPQEIVIPQEVRPLPGQLDEIPVFNSNSPEIVMKEGILLSTFPADDKVNPDAHLNFLFPERFDVFAHHIAKAPTAEDLRTLYLGVLLHNPTRKTVTVEVLTAASYLSQPDAPFIELPPHQENLLSMLYSGPGSRVMSDLLRKRRNRDLPREMVIPPGESRMLLNVPIPVRGLGSPINGRSTYMRLQSNGELYAASLAMFAPLNEGDQEREPNLAEWEELLAKGELVTPRDRAPTPPDATNGTRIYGRVAGVSQGSQWQTTLLDNGKDHLTIPVPGEAFSYGLSTLADGTFGTGQIQSAQMLVRYPDTAYHANGNYGVQYSLTLPFYNPSQETQSVTVKVQTPLKQEQIVEGLRFLEPPAEQVFFRGTVRIHYPDDQGESKTRHYHLVQHRGEQGEPLATINVPSNEQRLVQVDLLYPPDSTPPQVLTVETLNP